MSDSFGDGWNGASYTLFDASGSIVPGQSGIGLDNATYGDDLTTGSEFVCFISWMLQFCIHFGMQ